MKKFLIALMAVMLSITPVSAKKAEKKTDAKPECITMEQVEAKVTKEGIKVEKKLSGDDLQKLNAAVVKHGGSPAPTGLDGLIILSKEGIKYFIGIQIINGCAAGYFPINPEVLKKLLNEDDGSI